MSDLESGRALATLEGHAGGVNAYAVTPDGRRVVSASGDQTLKVAAGAAAPGVETARAWPTMQQPQQNCTWSATIGSRPPRRPPPAEPPGAEVAAHAEHVRGGWTAEAPTIPPA